MSNTYGDRIQQAVAAELRAERGAQDVTFDVLAERTGMPKATLSRYFKGTRDIPMSALAAICDGLGLTVLAIIDRAQARLDKQDAAAQLGDAG